MFLKMFLKIGISILAIDESNFMKVEGESVIVNINKKEKKKKFYVNNCS